ncbi:hypothetical protein DTO027B5_862 [Paecilomyces variotii]|nr:hypothetical protein DTO169C6_351 [Paecilomyces variotii]KAJ9283676.1 hypothetical protein DTO021C3_8747 [Paecilomyces variotii]KAJ9329688.1 hypothetical protein DTO027B3_175 [Paecilomyces variotii]KAJ9337513.1 hypothetical protein DTO027B5_862 [Paecilomyces variotii]KAJ9366525.1 hypothetical protein DTO282E5_8797 [Paecilomyces variotii]
MTTPETKKLLLDIYFVDQVTKAAELEKIVSVPEIEKEKTLSEVRDHLRTHKALTLREKTCKFCTTSGAELKDTLSFSDYIDLVATKDKEPGVNKDQQLDVLEHSKNGKENIRIYLRSRKRFTEMDEGTKEFLKQKFDFELKKAELLPDNARESLKGSYSHRDFMAEVGNGNIIHPVDMSEEQWHAVTETNALLHGNTIWRATIESPASVERAIYPTFRLKKRAIEYYFDDKDSENEPVENEPVENAGTMSATEKTEMLRIPRFIVTDDSYVDVSEHKSSVASAIASSSLSKSSSEVAIGGGAYGYSLGVSGGHEYETSERSRQRNQTETNHMVVTYNFPRVIVSLDKDSLELTKECKDHLKNINSREDAGSFKRKFGSFFSTKVQLGGRLHSTQESAAVTGSNIGEKTKRLKISAGISFAGPGVQATLKGGYGSDTNKTNETSSAAFDSQMAWDAKGGDTLLCNNPPAWCKTVSSYYNWRVVKQDNLVSITDMICDVEKDVGEKLKRFEGKPVNSKVDICFLHKPSGKYLGFNTEEDPLPPILLKDFNKRGFTPDAYPHVTERGPRKTVSLSESKDGNAQVFSLHGTMINDVKQRARVMADYAYTAWNADIDNYTGCVPRQAYFPYRRTQLQEIPTKKIETPVTFHFRAVNSQTEDGLPQGTEVVIDVYAGSVLLGEVRGAEGEEGAVVVDRGAKDGSLFRKDTDIVSTEPLVFTLRYQPYHLNS